MPAIAVSSMLELIGGTPLVRLRHLVDGSMADVFCKCEQFNPGGSLKDRVALSMIEAAEREGRLRCTVKNWVLTALWAAGADPARLARFYPPAG